MGRVGRRRRKQGGTGWRPRDCAGRPAAQSRCAAAAAPGADGVPPRTLRAWAYAEHAAQRGPDWQPQGGPLGRSARSTLHAAPPFAAAIRHQAPGAT